MGSRLKPSGMFFGLLFLVAALVNLLMGVIEDRSGLFTALTDFKDVSSLILLSAIMFASAYIPKLVWLQPAILLAVLPVPIFGNPESFYGLGFFACGVLLLFKLDFYKKFGVFKAVLSIGYIILLEVTCALIEKKDLYTGLMAVFFIFAFLFFLFLTFRERIVVYLKEPKIKLSLDAKGLAEAEQLYIRRMIGGKSVKEVSFEFGVSESTVRNTLSRAYKKLGVNSKAGVADLSQRYEIVQ